MAQPANQRLASALYVDFDNFYSHLRNEDSQAAGAFAVSPGGWIRWIENGLPGKISNGQLRAVAARYCYLNPRQFGRFAGGVIDVVTKSGSRLPVTPKFKASATARYTWPAGDGKAHVQSSIAYQTSAIADVRRDLGDGTNPNDFLGRIKGSTLVDVSAGYDWKKFNVELYVANLFDDRNELSRFVVCSVCTATKIVPGRPRTIGLRVGTKF